MSRNRWCAVLVLVAASLSLTVVAGCFGTMKRISPTKVNAASAAAEAMTMYDANKDGKISGVELDKCPSLKALGRDSKDGAITAEVIEARITQWQASKTGRVPTGVAVLHNGKGLADASVKLVPEKFLKDIATATGKTDGHGATDVTVPTAVLGEPKGASLGFYRVEITKDGESIPAKYNTETMLGVAVVGETSVSFNLVY